MKKELIKFLEADFDCSLNVNNYCTLEKYFVPGDKQGTKKDVIKLSFKDVNGIVYPYYMENLKERDWESLFATVIKENEKFFDAIKEKEIEKLKSGYTNFNGKEVEKK